MSRVAAEHLRKGDVLTDGRTIRAATVTWPDSEHVVVLIAGHPHTFGGGAENIAAKRRTTFHVDKFAHE